MATYKLSAAADHDLTRLYRYGISNFGEARADSYFDGLIAQFEQIASTPQLYQAVDDIRTGYRRSVFNAHAIYYRVTDGVVEIMRILGREDIETAF